MRSSWAPATGVLQFCQKNASFRIDQHSSMYVRALTEKYFGVIEQRKVSNQEISELLFSGF